jgi:DNA-binding transcriptional LysR family regulator
LKELETQLGERLFDRAGRRLILNENGRAAIPLAAAIIGRTEELATCFQPAAGLAGELALGAS